MSETWNKIKLVLHGLRWGILLQCQVQPIPQKKKKEWECLKHSKTSKQNQK